MIQKIIASDMDGTFLRSDHSFDKERFARILSAFKEKGYLFVAASGRPLLSLKHIFQGFEKEMAFVAENGSVVTYQDELIFMDEPIDKETCLALVDAIEQGSYGNSKTMILSGFKGAYLLESSDPDYVDFIKKFYINVQQVADFSQVEEPIVKIVATFPDDDLSEAQAWLNSQFEQVTAVTTGIESVDIILSGVNKSIGLSQLCAKFGLSSEDVIAFGDNQNDLEMLDYAGLGMATSNAKEDVKAIANQVIGSCEDDAVLEFMEMLI